MIERIIIDGKNYYLANKTTIDNIDYYYVAECDNDNDITGNFYLFKNNGSFIKVTDSDELKRVLLVVTSNLI